MMGKEIRESGVRGVLHPAAPPGDGLVLAHGAGSDHDAPLLVALGEAFSAAGISVLRIDLPFRQRRPQGPPPRGSAEEDRQGLRAAVAWMRSRVPGQIFLGGHSYGGRQSSMLAAEQPGLVEGLLLLSYPLHPPRRPEELRISHFPQLRTRVLFVHGTRDPFGSVEELEAARTLIPAPSSFAIVTGAGHDLFGPHTRDTLPALCVARFSDFFRKQPAA